MKIKYLSREEVDANVDSMLLCLNGRGVGTYPMFRRCRHTFFWNRHDELLFYWGKHAKEQNEDTYCKLCEVLCRICGASLTHDNSYERRRQWLFEMWDFCGFRHPSCVRTLIDIGVRKVHYLEKATEEETRIVNEAAEAFIVHTKELINVLAAQDLSGEGIRNFVSKVFKR